MTRVPPQVLAVGSVDGETIGNGWLTWLSSRHPQLVPLDYFPDGELKVRLPPVGDTIDVFCNFRTPATHRFDMQRLLHLCAVVRAAKQQGVSQLRVVTPELPCMRQDRPIYRSDSIELAGRELVLDLLLAAGVDLVCASYMKFDVSVPSLKLRFPTQTEIATWLVASGHFKHGAVIALDHGAEGLATEVASIAQVPSITLAKQRNGTDTRHTDLTARDRATLGGAGTALIVDDLLVSSSSLTSALATIARSCVVVSLDAFAWHVRPSMAYLPAISTLLQSGQIGTLLTSSLAPGAPGATAIPAQPLLCHLLEDH